MNKQSEIWWIHPAWVFCGSLAVTAIAALLVPDQLYRSLWGMPKYFDTAALWLCFGCLAFFGVGCMLPNLRPAGWRRSDGIPQNSQLPLGTLMNLYRVSFWMAMVGYGVWTSLALKRGLNLRVFMSLIVSKGGGADKIHDQYLGNITGITTFTEFGVATAVLGALIIAQRGWKTIWISQAVLFCAAFVRSIVNTERLALIELIIPIFVVMMQFVVVPRTKDSNLLKRTIQWFPIAGAACLYFVFAAFEYFRSWSNYYSNGPYSFWEFNAYRLSGYYVTALNNGIFLMHRLGSPLKAPFFTMNFLWRFPFISEITESIFTIPTGLEQYYHLLDRQANPEFNNPDGPLVAMIDFGVAGGLIYWLIIGALFGIIFRSFQRRNAWGLCLYPFIYLALIDVIRGLNWAGGRSVPPVCFLLVCGLLLRTAQRRQDEKTSPSLASQDVYSVPPGDKRSLLGHSPADQLS